MSRVGDEELVGALRRSIRRMGIQAVMFHQTVAERFGLGATDSRAWSILDETGPIAAGELAERTGLTTGAVTGIVDRLEEAGWVQREADPDDRRKVIIQPLRDPKRERVTSSLFESLHREFGRLAGRYGEDELALILDFITSCTDLLREETRMLRRSDHLSRASAAEP